MVSVVVIKVSTRVHHDLRVIRLLMLRQHHNRWVSHCQLLLLYVELLLLLLVLIVLGQECALILLQGKSFCLLDYLARSILFFGE